MRKDLLLTSLIAIIAAGGTASAQDVSSAVMAGRVTTQDGAPLQGVRVTIQSSALLGPRNAVTDANGQFRTSLLPGGEYTVTYVLDGYVTRKLTTRLVAGQVGNANVRLTKIDVLEETVEITGGQAQVDKTDTVVQTVLSKDFLAPLMNNNDWISMRDLVPSLSVRGSTGEMMVGEVTIRGGQFRSLKVLVNGLNNTDMYGGYTHSTSGAILPLQDLIESVAVMLSPLNARHGNSDGGLMSVVTSRGSNDFKGTFRVRLSAPFWNTRDVGYPYRGTRPLGSVTPSTDNLTKNYEISLQGPLWKDHLTFAYGAELTPTVYTTTTRWGNWSNPTPRPENAVGVYFQDPATGDIVRRSELYSATVPNDPSSTWYTEDYIERNHFTVFAQITPNHQLEYNYNQYLRSLSNRYGAPPLIDMDPKNIQITLKRNWSAAYKGLIGSNGILDVSYGKTFNESDDGRNGGKPIYLYQIPSYVPINGKYDDYAASNYWVNGYIDNQVNPTRGSVSSYTIDYNGADVASSGGNDAFALNYQHMLNTTMGSHIIDVGMSNNKSYRTPNSDSGWEAAPYVFYNTGQIAMNLGANPWDVYNPNNPNAIANASRYAGKFIVFNVPAATYRDIDPVGAAYWAANRPDLLPNPDANVLTGGRIASNIYPRMRKRFGPESGEFGVTMQSFYLNDMWSINDHHSLMLGVRFDNFTLWDSANSNVHSYSKPTFRSEYKWDILGDQSRLVNVSLAQFHNQNQISQFQATLGSLRLPNYSDYYWTGAAISGARQDGKPYLVTKDQVLDENNYTHMYSTALAATAGAKLDPDFKAPTSTEFAIGFTRNFRNGGSWKASFVYRTWIDLFEILPDAAGTDVNIINGQKQLMRTLKNTDAFEKTYKAFELEWNLPLTKRLTFGGNYTYARLMHNLTQYASGRNEARGLTNWNSNVNWYEYWDKFWPRETWAPIYNQGPEHDTGFYLTYDLSTGKARSSIALRGWYTGGDVAFDSWTWVAGYPNSATLPWLSGLVDYGSPSSVPGGFNSNSRGIPFNQRLNDDTWGLTMRYHFEMPLVRRLSWFVTMDMTNPFNHRGINAWFGPGGPGGGTNYLVDIMGPNGVVNRANDYYKGVWFTNSNVEGQYRSYQSGRSFSLQTGLRF